MNTLMKIKTKNINTRQLAHMIRKHKMEQFNKMVERNIYLTSDDSITLTQETLEGNLIWNEIKGTRTSLVICYDSTTFEIKRRPNNAKVLKKEYAFNLSARELVKA